MPIRSIAPAALALLLLAGCAELPLRSDRLAPDRFKATELRDLPFFPQERFQCGPAALATVLSWNGVAVVPDQLTPRLYLPGKKGSLQVELLAAARRYGQLPYPLRPELEDLLTELEAGHPVLVLQNLAYSWFPRWHYTVVAGFDPERRVMVLRSGTERRHLVALRTFERTWLRGGGWAVVVLRPGDLPATAEERAYLRAAAALERSDPAAAESAYAAATRRWPASGAAWFGLGNSAFARGDYGAAATAYRSALRFNPASPPVHNNLAEALARLGRYDEAERHAREAVAGAEGEEKVYRRTLEEIRAKKRDGRCERSEAISQKPINLKPSVNPADHP